MQISSVSPRGGAAGTMLTILGSGFGTAAQGRVIFDPAPTGPNINGIPTSWSDSQIQVPIPAGIGANRNIRVQVMDGGRHTAEVQIWSPAPGASLTDGLDYFITDDETLEPAQINRIMDRLAATTLLVPGLIVDRPVVPTPPLPAQFILSRTPIDPTNVIMFVNGIAFAYGGGAWSLAGTVLNWTNPAFALDVTDAIAIEYTH